METEPLLFDYDVIDETENPPKLRLTTYLGPAGPCAVASHYPEGQVAVLGHLAKDTDRRVKLQNGQEGAIMQDSPIGTLILPATLERVERNALAQCRALSIVNLLACDHVTLEDGAFQGCYGLRSAFLPPNLTTIPANLFYYCHNLGFVKLPKNLTRIEKNAFGSCFQLKNIALPPTLTHLGEAAFSQCRTLEEIAIPTTVTEIAPHLFSGCKSLTTVTLHDQISAIGAGAFDGCQRLTAVDIPPSVVKIGENAFPAGVVAKHPSYPHHILTDFYKKDATAHTIHLLHQLETVADPTTLCNQFRQCEALMVLVLATKDVDHLTLVLKHQLLTNRLANLFLGVYEAHPEMSRLLSVYCAQTEEEDADDEFDPFAEMTLFELSLAFQYTRTRGGLVLTQYYGCQTNLSIPDSVEGIPVVEVANLGKNNVVETIIFGQGIRSIGRECCSNFAALTKVTLPSQCVRIGVAAFRGCKKLKNITLPDQCTTLGDTAFAACMALESISIPEGVQQVPPLCFLHCASLAQVSLPSTLRKIGENAFGCCPSLISVTLPNSVTEIGADAFTDTPIEWKSS